MLELAVADARRLVEAAAGFHHHFADALVLELHPALEHVDELRLAVVRVPLAVRGFAGARADHVRHQLSAGRTLDAQVAVFEVAAQPAPLELGGFCVTDAEGGHGSELAVKTPEILR